MRLAPTSILKRMDVKHLDFPDAHFDAAVATFLFCVLPNEDQPAALRELARVVKPGAPIRLLEYQRPQGMLRRFSARLWEPWMFWAYGAGFDRRTEEHAREVGLEDRRHAVRLFDDLIKLIELRSG